MLNSRFALEHRYKVDKIDIPKDLAKNVGGGTDVVSTQAAFGAVMLELSKEDTEFTRRLLTCAPDVATTTQLSGYVNKKGIFSKGVTKDKFRALSQTTLNNWKSNPKGAHVELGIAENNLMILIGAAGLSHEIFGQRLFPVGTWCSSTKREKFNHIPQIITVSLTRVTTHLRITNILRIAHYDEQNT